MPIFKEWLVEKGLTQSDASRIFDKHRNTIGNWVIDDSRFPDELRERISDPNYNPQKDLPFQVRRGRPRKEDEAIHQINGEGTMAKLSRDQEAKINEVVNKGRITEVDGVSVYQRLGDGSVALKESFSAQTGNRRDNVPDEDEVSEVVSQFEAYCEYAEMTGKAGAVVGISAIQHGKTIFGFEPREMAGKKFFIVYISATPEGLTRLISTARMLDSGIKDALCRD